MTAVRRAGGPGTTVPAVGSPPPTARALRARLRAARRERGGRGAMGRVGDLSSPVLVALVVAGALVSFVSAVAGGPAVPEPEELASLRWLVLVGAVAAWAGVVRSLLTIGPVVVGATKRFWLLGAPVSRRGFLAPTMVALSSGIAALGGLVGVVLAALASLRGPGVLLAGAAGVAGGALAVAVAVLGQSVPDGPRRLRWAVDGVLAACVVGGVVLAAPAGWMVTLPAPSSAWVVVLGVVAVVASLASWVRLARVGRATLTAGADLAGTASVAVWWLDLSVLSSALDEKAMRRRGRVRSRRLRGTRVTVSLRADCLRLLRRPARGVVWAVLLLVPYAVAGVALPEATVAVVQALGAALATDRLAGGLRTVARSPGLRRALGGTDRHLLLAHLVVPGVGALLWVLLTAPALPSSTWWCSAVSVLGAVLVTYRLATRPPLSYDLTLYDTGLGPMPLNLIRELSRGPLLLVLVVVAQLAIVG
ncbi:DUF6297 family protein [Actinoalloteichus caeruleus]|uniref:DUF6297 family protein n=1 Tax=Actinoalloteichus cyanogriseus TaxID=2893586 RepID=UPI003AAE5905